MEVERALEKRLLPLRPKEQELWWLDQRINDRGVKIDLDLVQAAQEVVDAATQQLNTEMKETTNGAVTACTNAGQLTAWLKDHGVETDSVAKGVLPELLGLDIPPHVRRAIELRQEAAKSSTAKLKTMMSVSGKDGRARGLFQYHAASTGRFGGRLIQLQNLPRPDLQQQEISDAIQIMSN